MKTILIALAIGVVVPGTVLGADPARNPMVAQAKTDTGAMPKVAEARLVSVRGTVEAIDKEKQTVTLKGPQRSLTVKVRDPKKLDAISHYASAHHTTLLSAALHLKIIVKMPFLGLGDLSNHAARNPAGWLLIILMTVLSFSCLSMKALPRVGKNFS